MNKLSLLWIWIVTSLSLTSCQSEAEWRASRIINLLEHTEEKVDHATIKILKYSYPIDSIWLSKLQYIKDDINEFKADYRNYTVSNTATRYRSANSV